MPVSGAAQGSIQAQAMRITVHQTLLRKAARRGLLGVLLGAAVGWNKGVCMPGS